MSAASEQYYSPTDSDSDEPPEQDNDLDAPEQEVLCMALCIMVS